MAHGQAKFAALLEDVCAESPDAGQIVGKVDFAILIETLLGVLGDDVCDDGIDPVDSGEGSFNGDELAVNAENDGRADFDVHVGRATINGSFENTRKNVHAADANKGVSVAPAKNAHLSVARAGENLIEENRLEKLAAAIETGVEDGMQTFNQALYTLVKAGTVSEKEALSKATNPQALEMNFKGIFLDEARRILS